MSSTTRECGSFSSVSNTGEVDEEVLPHQQLQYHQHHNNPLFQANPPAIGNDEGDLPHITAPSAPPPRPLPVKKKRSLPGTPDPNAEVIALSPKTLMATNRFVCEVCHKGFQRDQNLQLHRRGHNLPWKLRQRVGSEARKRVYVCPEPGCVHHNPSRALGDLTGIKKHYCRKHGEKKWKCDKCGKKYAVQSDWKAHAKICGTREYKCDCGTVFSRRDSFITHRAFCDALAQENNKLAQPMNMATVASSLQGQAHHLMLPLQADGGSDAGVSGFGHEMKRPHLKMLSDDIAVNPLRPLSMAGCMLSSFSPRNAPSPSFFPMSRKGPMGLDGPNDAKMGLSVAGSASMSATALLQKAAEMGATTSGYNVGFPPMQMGLTSVMAGPDQFSSVSPFGPIRVHGPYNGPPSNQTQLVGFDGGGLSSHLYNDAVHDMGAMTRAIGPLMNEGDQILKRERGGAWPAGRRADDVRIVDYMGVEGQRSFSGLNPFGPHMGHGPNSLEKPIWDV